MILKEILRKDSFTERMKKGLTWTAKEVVESASL